MSADQQCFEDRLLATILDDFENLAAVPGRQDGHERPSSAHHRSVARRAVPAVAAAAAAAVVLAALVATRSDGPAPRSNSSASSSIGPTHAQLVLDRLADASAASVPTDGRYVVLSEVDTDGTGSDQIERTTVVDTQTGASTTYQLGPAGTAIPPVLTQGPTSTSTAAWFASLPTGVTPLRAELLSLSTHQQAAATAELRQQAAQAGKPIPAAPAAVPLTDDDDVYDEAADLLWDPLVQPTLRSALYKVLATTPGVDVTQHATDPAGRPAVAMSRQFAGADESETTYEDPTTGSVLAQVWDIGGTTTTAVYQPVTSANAVPADPYGS